MILSHAATNSTLEYTHTYSQNFSTIKTFKLSCTYQTSCWQEIHYIFAAPSFHSFLWRNKKKNHCGNLIFQSNNCAGGTLDKMWWRNLWEIIKTRLMEDFIRFELTFRKKDTIFFRIISNGSFSFVFPLLRNFEVFFFYSRNGYFLLREGFSPEIWMIELFFDHITLGVRNRMKKLFDQFRSFDTPPIIIGWRNFLVIYFVAPLI